jgi:nitroreductase
MRTTRRNAIQAAGISGAGIAIAAAGDQAGTDPDGLLPVFPKRQTVRRYKPDPAPDDRVRMILDAARRAPTCMNQQPWKFLAVRDKLKIERMRKLAMEHLEKRYLEQVANDPKLTPAERAERKKSAVTMTEGYFTAPVYVAVLVDSESSCSGYALKHDGPLAAGYLMLAARALGYGAAYLTDGIPESVVREGLGIPSRWQRICITPIGVPDGWPEPKPKKKLEELVAYESL